MQASSQGLASRTTLDATCRKGYDPFSSSCTALGLAGSRAGLVGSCACRLL